MELVRIFGEEEDNAIFAIRYEKGTTDEFERLFDLWDDALYIEGFCNENQEDLKGAFKRPITIEEAADEIMKEAEEMERLLYDYCESAQLQELFKPLHNDVYEISAHLQQSKTSPKTRYFRSPKIRIYAIKISTNVFVITGGAIKLTKTMNDRPHLLAELEKLKKVRNWLQQNGINTPEALNDLV